MLIFILALTASAMIPETFSQEEKLSILKELTKDFRKSKVHYLGEEKGWGMVATQDIQKGTEIETSTLENRFVAFEEFEWSEYLQGASGYLKTVIRLVYERLVNHKNSKDNLWAHLPSGEINSFLNWTQFEKDYLQSRFKIPIKLESPLNYEEHKKDYMHYLNRVPGINSTCQQCLTEEAWMWGLFTFASRMFSIDKELWRQIIGQAANESDSNELGGCFLTQLEFFNHLPEPLETRSQVFNKSVDFYYPGHVTLYADRDLQKGQEVTFSYNLNSNKDLFAEYGFVLEKNINDLIYVYTEEVKQCPLRTPEFLENGYCWFRLRLYNLNKQLFKYLFFSYEGYRTAPGFEIETIFEKSPRLRMSVLRTLLRYRRILNYNNLGLCTQPFHFKSNQSNKRLKLVDQFCLASHYSFFYHSKFLDRSVIDKYLKILY